MENDEPIIHVTINCTAKFAIIKETLKENKNERRS